MTSSQKKPRLLFYAIAITLPFLLLGSAELLLRAFNFGQSYPLFVPSQQIEGFVEPNTDIIKRFFYPADTAPNVAPDTYLFNAEKTPESIRIVSLGGSTMAGFPYGRFGSPSGMLKQRINASHPELDIELISVAMSSINTFSLLDYVDEVIDISPDAILIYAGHNEYLGVMGVGSSFAGKGSYSANLLFLKFKEWRLYQLIQKTYYELVTHNRQETENKSKRTLMAQVAKEKDIAYQSPLFEAGKAQFEQNLRLILAKFKAAGIPVYLSTIASNEKDQAPFNSSKDKKYNADTAYQKGKASLKNARTQQAKAYFSNARDYDLLRFRAPSEFNAIIKQSAEQHGAYLVDAKRALEDVASQGIIGNELMLEHLHPNARGYFEIAEAFYQSLITHGTLAEASYAVSKQQAWQWQPLSSVDDAYAAVKVGQLMSDYPFSATPQDFSVTDTIATALDNSLDNANQSALALQRVQGESFVSVQKRLIETLQKEQRWLQAGIAAGVLFDALPNQHQPARVASLLLLRANALPLAHYYAKQAVKLNPQNSNYKLSLAEILFKSNQLRAAINMLDEVIAQDPNNLKAKQIKRSIGG